MDRITVFLLHRRLLGWALLTAVLVVILLAINSAGTLAGNYTEDWNGDVLSRWEWAPGGCDYFAVQGNTLELYCNSGGLRTIARYDHTQPITVEGAIRVERIADYGYWAGLIIVARDDWEGCDYRNQALNWWQDNAGVDYDQFTVLHNTGVCEAGKVNTKLTAGDWHTFKMAYQYECSGSWWWQSCNWITRYYLDGAQVYSGTGRLAEPVQIGTECVSVVPGQPNQGERARCWFGPLSISGTVVGSPEPTPTLTPTPTQEPTPEPCRPWWHRKCR